MAARAWCVMFSAVAEWLTAPDTQYLLDFVRPDMLMLRMISKGLVMWHTVHPSPAWIHSNLPKVRAIRCGYRDLCPLLKSLKLVFHVYFYAKDVCVNNYCVFI